MIKMLASYWSTSTKVRLYADYINLRVQYKNIQGCFLIWFSRYLQIFKIQIQCHDERIRLPVAFGC